MFSNVFIILAKSKYLSFFSFDLNFFFLTTTWSSLLTGIGYPFISHFFYYYFTPCEFFTQSSIVIYLFVSVFCVFNWTLSERNFPQILNTLQNIRADFSRAVFWMVLIVSSPSLFFISIRITVTFTFQNLFSSLVRSRYLISFSLFCYWGGGKYCSAILLFRMLQGLIKILTIRKFDEDWLF